MITLSNDKKQQLLLNAVFLFGNSINSKTTFLVVNTEDTIEEWNNQEYPDPALYPYFNHEYWTILCDISEFKIAVENSIKKDSQLNILNYLSSDFSLKDHLF